MPPTHPVRHPWIPGPTLLIRRTSGAKIKRKAGIAKRFQGFGLPVKGYGVEEYAKLLERILGGRFDANIRFSDLVQLLLHLGFDERTRSDHHIFTLDGIEEILNLQPKGSLARPYQVKQVRNVILRYKLGADENG